MGAWIEITAQTLRKSCITVAPSMGAWIEIKAGLSYDVAENKSLPLWERGLKLIKTVITEAIAWSLPLWERGLKSPLSSRILRGRAVAPSMGAWIEIIYSGMAVPCI